LACGAGKGVSVVYSDPDGGVVRSDPKTANTSFTQSSHSVAVDRDGGGEFVFAPAFPS